MEVPFPDLTENVLFISLASPHPSIRKLVSIPNNDNIDEALANEILFSLKKWIHFSLAILFDESIANTDRQIGNILFGGGEFALIDHERSLKIGGDSPIKNNRLAELSLEDEFTRNKCRKRILGPLLEKFKNIDYQRLLECARVDLYYDGDPFILIERLKERVDNLKSIMNVIYDNSHALSDMMPESIK